jgi:replicative DNA helicase
MHIQVGRLYGIIGPPGAGKTSIGLTILNNTSVQGDHSIFFSYDMSKYDVYQKLIQKHTKKNRDALYKVYKEGSKEDQQKLSQAVNDQYKNVRFVFKTGQSIEEMRNTIISTEKKLGINIRLVIVDYLELVQSKFSDATQSSAEVIQGLREIAINMNKAVIVFLQPNKMSSTIDMPILSYNAAKGSSAIAQAVTAMLTIHRPGYSSRTPENDKFLSIDCVKNRAGPLFSADMFWDGLTGSIRDLDDAERLHLREVRKAKEEQQSDEDYIKF